MTIFDPESINTHLRTREYIDLLDAGESKQTYFVRALYEKRLVYAEAAALEVYHGLVWLLEAYPTIVSVHPQWHPEIDSDDKSMIVRFRLNIVSQEASGEVADEYGYEEYRGIPPSIEALANPAAYDQMIELGEGVGPEIWNEFTPFSVCNRKTPYTSVAEIKADMTQDLERFMPRVQQFILERCTAKPANKSGAKPQRF